MDQWRSHIPRNNLPKQFCERCFEQGDRKWQQNELGLWFELVSDVCGRKKECVVAGISGREPPWDHEAGGTPRGVGRALHPRGGLVSSPDCYLFLYFSKYSKTEKYCLKIVLESVYLLYHIPIPFRSLEHSGKCPLCIPPGLRFQ